MAFLTLVGNPFSMSKTLVGIQIPGVDIIVTSGASIGYTQDGCENFVSGRGILEKRCLYSVMNFVYFVHFSTNLYSL